MVVEEKSEMKQISNDFDKMLMTADGNAIHNIYMQTGNNSLIGRMVN